MKKVIVWVMSVFMAIVVSSCNSIVPAGTDVSNDSDSSKSSLEILAENPVYYQTPYIGRDSGTFFSLKSSTVSKIRKIRLGYNGHGITGIRITYENGYNPSVGSFGAYVESTLTDGDYISEIVVKHGTPWVSTFYGGRKHRDRVVCEIVMKTANNPEGWLTARNTGNVDNRITSTYNYENRELVGISGKNSGNINYISLIYKNR